MLLPTLAEPGAVREPLAARPVPRGYEPVESDRHQTRTVTADAHAAAIIARGGDFVPRSRATLGRSSPTPRALAGMAVLHALMMLTPDAPATVQADPGSPGSI
jgi:hypothetical protein